MKTNINFDVKFSGSIETSFAFQFIIYIIYLLERFVLLLVLNIQHHYSDQVLLPSRNKINKSTK